MPLFQPTNITPSSFAGIGGGCVAASDPVSISWQVNGNVPMTDFEITIYRNNIASSVVTTRSEHFSDNPFYGTDSKGNPRFYTYQPLAQNGVDRLTWADLGLTDGNSYKMAITQSWREGSTIKDLQQQSPAVFITRTAPTLSINQFSGGSLTVDGLTQSFTATFSQAQGDGINWARWQFFKKNADSSYDLIDDTGKVNTFDLSYQADGLITGNVYSINCTVETQNGIIATTGNMDFLVLYQTVNETNPVDYTCKKDSSILIGLGEITEITGVPSSAGSLENGALELESTETITWSQYQSGNAIGFKQPLSILWKGDCTRFKKVFEDLSFSKVYAMDSYASTGATYLYVAGEVGYDYVLRSYAKQSDGSYEQISETIINDLNISTNGTCVSANWLGRWVVVSGLNAVYAFPVSNGVLGNPTIFDLGLVVAYSKFSPDGKYLIVGGTFGTNLYSVTNQSISFLSSFQAFGRGVPSFSCAISNNASFPFVALGGYGAQALIFLFQISGSTIQHVSSLAPNSNLNTSYYCQNLLFGNSPETNRVRIFVGGYYYVIGYTTMFNSWFDIDEGGNFYASTNNAFVDAASLSRVQNSWKTTPENLSVSYLSDGLGVYRFMEETAQVEFLYAFREMDLDVNTNINPCAFFGDQDMAFVGYMIGTNGLTVYEQNLTQSSSITLECGANDYFIKISPYTIDISPNYPTGQTTQFPIKGANVIVGISWNNNNNYTLSCTFLNALGQMQNQSFRSSVGTVGVVTSVELRGYLKTDFLYIKTGSIPLENVTAIPQPDDDTYLLTNFSGQSLNAISYAGNASSSYLYRMENDRLRRLYRLGSAVYLIKDFGLKSGQTYSYEIVTETDSGDLLPALISDAICVKYNAYFLIEATQDAEFPNVYHALNVWTFGSNLQAGAVSNNNSPNWLLNFTPYRLRQPSSQAGKSGTLQALLSNPQGLSYSDTAQMQEELYAASLSNNEFFLKDTKGNLMMVRISAPITQTINLKSSVQEVTVSVPWEETGNADDISLIQTPLDQGWEG